MADMKAPDQAQVLDLYRGFAGGRIDRREFMRSATVLGIAGAAASALGVLSAAPSEAAVQEAAKKRGDVLDYKVLAVDNPRDHEPDVILMVEFKNMAVFDRSRAELDAQSAAAFGSVAKSNQSAISRESMRTQRGSVLTREILLGK
jgi:hypothetical protein